MTTIPLWSISIDSDRAKSDTYRSPRVISPWILAFNWISISRFKSRRSRSCSLLFLDPSIVSVTSLVVISASFGGVRSDRMISGFLPEATCRSLSEDLKTVCWWRASRLRDARVLGVLCLCSSMWVWPSSSGSSRRVSCGRWSSLGLSWPRASATLSETSLRYAVWVVMSVNIWSKNHLHYYNQLPAPNPFFEAVKGEWGLDMDHREDSVKVREQ